VVDDRKSVETDRQPLIVDKLSIGLVDKTVMGTSVVVVVAAAAVVVVVDNAQLESIEDIQDSHNIAMLGNCCPERKEETSYC